MNGVFHSDDCIVTRAHYPTCTDRCYERQDELGLRWVTKNPAAALREINDLTERVKFFSHGMYVAESRLLSHWFFSYPHFWLWHALFDGTWLCRCWHSHELKSHNAG